MLNLVRTDVQLPSDMSPDKAEDIKAREKAYSQSLQREGKWDLSGDLAPQIRLALCARSRTGN